MSVQTQEHHFENAISISKGLITHNDFLSRELQLALQGKRHLEALVCSLRKELKETQAQVARLEGRCKALQAKIAGDTSDVDHVKQLEEVTVYVKGLEREVMELRKHQVVELPRQNHPVIGDYFRESHTGEELVSPVLSMDSQEGILVPGRPKQRLNPGEEYFTLVTQAIRINLGGVRDIATKELYEKAMKAGVTFDKWHTWVEAQLRETLS